MDEQEKKLEQEEITQGVEPSIEVDTVAETTPSDEVAVSEVESSDSEVEGEKVETEASDEKATEEADKTDEGSSDEEQKDEKVEDEGSKDKEEPTTEAQEEPPVEAADVEAVEPEEIELSEEDRMKAELAELRAEKEDAEIAQDFINTVKETEEQIETVKANVQDAVNKVAAKYQIPIDISMEQLEKLDPTKAAIAKEIIMKANEEIQRAEAQLSEVREDKAREVVFKKAEKEFAKFELTDEQKGIAAQTFVNIIAQTGVMDLAEDLKAKVKLSVAQARMDSPVVAKVAEVAQEILDETEPKEVKEETTDTTVSKEPSPEISEAKEEVTEEKSESTPSPDISEFKEGVTGQVTKAQAVTVDNVLAKLNALPFKERTAFYKENVDLINEAMTKKRMAE